MTRLINRDVLHIVKGWNNCGNALMSSATLAFFLNRYRVLIHVCPTEFFKAVEAYQRFVVANHPFKVERLQPLEDDIERACEGFSVSYDAFEKYCIEVKARRASHCRRFKPRKKNVCSGLSLLRREF